MPEHAWPPISKDVDLESRNIKVLPHADIYLFKQKYQLHKVIHNHTIHIRPGQWRHHASMHLLVGLYISARRATYLHVGLYINYSMLALLLALGRHWPSTYVHLIR